MTVKNTFLYPSSIWLIKRLKVSKARKDRDCVICKISVFQNEDYPGEYLRLSQNESTIVCVRCAFRLVSHPVFRHYHALTHEAVKSSEFCTMQLFKVLREVYKFDHIYLELILEDRQQEKKFLTKCDFDHPSSHYVNDWLDKKYATAYKNSYIQNMIEHIRKGS